MPIPDFQTLMLPLLRLAAESEISTTDLVARLSDAFKLTKEERAERLPSGRQARMANRVHWAVAYLGKAGLLERIRRGYYRVTDQGQSVLSDLPTRIDISFLSRFERFREFHSPTGMNEGKVDGAQPSVAGTPEERIDAAYVDLHTTLRTELLDRILNMSPAAFEKLIIDLMLGMRYGAAGAGEHLGRTGDGGVDGVINEDVLGLDIIYLQAKRYALNNAVGVEKVREFAGALDERGATKGVLVTTSYFAPPARHYASRSPKRLVLIDGAELTRLLVEHGVAVRTYRTLTLNRIDTDYFDDLRD